MLLLFINFQGAIRSDQQQAITSLKIGLLMRKDDLFASEYNYQVYFFLILCWTAFLDTLADIRTVFLDGPDDQSSIARQVDGDARFE
jgi:hypothetical protein